MARPLVSIITPVLNRVETMRLCLDSVAGQTYQPIEHIVVDGGSTDGTQDLIRKHRPTYRYRWISEPDDGMYEAINKGISLAQGDVLAYLNSDDFYLPWSVGVAVRALQPPIELTYGDLGIVSVAADGNPTAFSIQFYPDFDLRYYSFVGVLGQPTVFWRRSLTARIGLFDSRYRLIGDCEYWLRAAQRGATFKHVPELLAVQVEHETTLRATQAVRLRAEFSTLRDAMRTVVDPPSCIRCEQLKKSVVWRVRQLEFIYAMKSGRPHKWGHLVKELRAHGIDVSSRDLRLLAPARWRGDATLLRDPSRIYAILSRSDEL